MTCGPGVAVERRDGAVLRCPRCGDEQQVPDLPLFVVTGASGTGKSAVTGPLRRQLPHCEIFDADALLPVAALGLDTWRSTWLRLAHDIALNGRVTVLAGSLLPSQLALLARRVPRVSHRRASAFRRLAANPYPALLGHQRAQPR
jgi:hypothetical protein